MSWCASLTAWLAILRLLEINSVNNNNNDNTLLQEGHVNNDCGLLKEWQVDDDKSDNNNKDKVYSFLKIWG